MNLRFSIELSHFRITMRDLIFNVEKERKKEMVDDGFQIFVEKENGIFIKSDTELRYELFMMLSLNISYDISIDIINYITKIY